MIDARPAARLRAPKAVASRARGSTLNEAYLAITGRQREISTTHHVPVHDPAGTIIGMLQKALDVATEVEAEPMHPIDFQDLEHGPRKVTESA